MRREEEEKGKEALSDSAAWVVAPSEASTPTPLNRDTQRPTRRRSFCCRTVLARLALLICNIARHSAPGCHSSKGQETVCSETE